MANVKSFIGSIYLAEVNDVGIVTGPWNYAGEAYPLTVKLTDEIVKIRGRTTLTAGAVIGTKSKPGDASGGITLHEYTADNVAKALKALVTTRAVSASALTNEAVTLTGFNEYTAIGTEDLSGVVVKNDTGDTTYVVDVDYKINLVLGLITPLSTGDIGATDTLHISGTGGANTDERIIIGAGSSAKYAIKGELRDEFTNKPSKLYLKKVLMVASKEVNFVSDEGTDHETLEFELTPEIPTGDSDYGYVDGLPAK